MKTMLAVACLVFLSSVNAVVNQEAQRREAPPSKEYGAPIQPQQKYGPPVNQRRVQAMQRLIAAMRAQQAGGYASQGRVVNRPRPIPLQKPQVAYGPPPQNTYGPPSHATAGGHSSSSGSLQAFTHSHTPGVSCEGWIPIPGPSHGTANSASGSSSIGSNVDTSYGPPSHSSSHSSGSGHASQGTIIVVPEDSYGPPPPSNPQSTYGTPNIGHSSSGHASSSNHASIDTSYGVPPQPIAPQNTYGAPSGHSASGHASSSSSFGSIDTSYGVPSQPQNNYGPPQVSGHGHSSSSSINAIDTSYGIPEPPHPQPQVPHKEYGVPKHFSSGGSSHSSQQPDIPVQPLPVSPPQIEYGPPPEIITHESSHQHSSGGGSFSIEQSYGPPSQPQPQPQIEYGPPVIVGSGHASSATAIEQSYGAPSQPSAPAIEYGTPQFSSGGHSSSSSSSSFNGHQTYGIPQQPQIDFGPPESSYGPPPSGAVHHEETRHGHAADIHTVQSIGTELQLPEAQSNIPFSNDISIGASALGVSAGNSEVIKSHAIHESHTSEVTQNHNQIQIQNHNSNAGDTYSAPPLDSYAPGKYAPSFLTRKPIAPTPPARRPAFIPQQRPQYIPPVPVKLNRPQHPPPNFRPLPQNGHAHSIAQSYSSSGHSQSAIRQQAPRQPLVYRTPVPQGLLQSIGHQVQAQDNGHRAHLQSGNTYLPPPTNELPIPPMKLVVPNSGPIQPFHAQQQQQQHQHHSSSGGGVATSSSSFSLQNQDIRHVHVIHDCGKGPQLSQNYGAPQQSYGTPIGDSHSAVLSAGYTIPAHGLETPQHNSVSFIQQPSNSYGPPASGPANLDVIGLESRNNAVVAELQTSESKTVSQTLPGLSGGLSDSGLDFISAHKSHTLVLPKNQGSASDFKFHIQGSHSENRDNHLDGPDHQQILADGLLQSILSAIEQQPGSQSVPQVSEDVETEHKDAKLFLGSREGQEVLADKNGNVESAH